MNLALPYAFAFLLLLTACESGEQSALNRPEKPEAPAALQPADTLEPLLIARGHEPGWYAQIFQNRLRLLYNYGKDSLHVYNDFSAAGSGNVFQLIKPANCEALTIEIKKESCTEAGSGEVRERTIVITLGELRLRGCASSNTQ